MKPRYREQAVSRPYRPYRVANCRHFDRFTVIWPKTGVTANILRMRLRTCGFFFIRFLKDTEQIKNSVDLKSIRKIFKKDILLCHPVRLLTHIDHRKYLKKNVAAHFHDGRSHGATEYEVRHCKIVVPLFTGCTC